MDFDFDKMKVLARENPQEFERQRYILLDELIQSRADVKWAKAFQSHIDMERRRSKTPLGCCIRLNSMMWDTFLKLDEQLQKLLHEQPPGEHKTSRPAEPKEPASAKILMFRKR